MNDNEERAYVNGSNAVWRFIMAEALNHLGYDGGWPTERLILEREATRAALRKICEKHGDNTWPDDMHLADVIDKHLANYLSEASKAP